MIKPRRLCLILLLALATFAPFAAQVARADQAAEADLRSQVYLLWQWINVARANPRQVMARLGIDEQTVRNVLGPDAWILDQGLPPLAWSDQLRAAAQDHDNEMIARVYYSYLSAQGATPDQRVVASGYQAVASNETLGALVFQNYLAPAEALPVMFDNMLRDELTGAPGVARNIFSTSLTEVGIGITAGSVALLAGQPYVYLLTLDFAAPASGRRFVVGLADPDSQVMVQNLYTGFWDVAPPLPGGWFQARLSGNGEKLYSVGPGEQVRGAASTQGLAVDRNYYFDLRSASYRP